VKEDMNGLRVVRVALPRLPRRLPLARGLWQFSCSLAFTPVALLGARPKVALVYSPPLPLGLTGSLLRSLRGVPFVLNVQDLFPQSVVDLGLLRSHFLIRFFERMERFVYRCAAHITVHSPGNRDHVIGTGAQPEKVTVIPNWIDTTFLHPGPKENAFRQAHGLKGKFVVSFAGVIGYSQDLDTVLAAAQLISNAPDIVFLIVGDGVEKRRLMDKAKELRLSNVKFLPMQPRGRYLQVIQASDVSLATLRSDVRTPVVPSKILSVMAVGRPVITALDLSGDAPKLVKEAQCGLVLPPEAPSALAEAILKLYNDRAFGNQLGRNGRAYTEEHLSLQRAAEWYENLMMEIVKGTGGPDGRLW